MNSPPEDVQDEAASVSFKEAAPLVAIFAALYAAVAAILVAPIRVTPQWLLVSGGLALVLCVLSAIDLKSYRLPDVLTLPLAAAGLVLAWVAGDGALPWHTASAVAGFAVLALLAILYERLRGQPGLGLGDAKLFGAAGAWLGAEHLPVVMLIAALTALGPALANAVRQRTLDGKAALAFGPYLALAFWIAWLIGP